MMKRTVLNCKCCVPSLSGVLVHCTVYVLFLSYNEVINVAKERTKKINNYKNETFRSSLIIIKIKRHKCFRGNISIIFIFFHRTGEAGEEVFSSG
jgi:hypothetical protein